MLDSFLDEVEKASQTPKLPPEERKALLNKVEQELVLFDQFMKLPVDKGGCGHDGLVPMEAALIRTYLVARLSGRFPSVLED